MQTDTIARDSVRAVNPGRRALVSALLYVLFCTAYIWLSGALAAQVAVDASQLAQIEVLKGTAFILVTGALFFLISLVRWKRIKADSETIRAQQEALLQAERRSVAGMYAASLAHDLNNLLTALGGLVEELKEQNLENSFAVAMRKHVEKALENLGDFASRLSSTASSSLPSKRETIKLRNFVNDALQLLRRHASVRFCEITVSIDPDIRIHTNPALFRDAMTNLVINAAQAGEGQARVEIVAEVKDRRLILQVHDDGPGVPPDLRESVFDACFTTKNSGSGLGLMTVRAFVAAEGGSVQVGDSDLGGACFEFSLPFVRTEPQAEDSTEAALKEP